MTKTILFLFLIGIGVHVQSQNNSVPNKIDVNFHFGNRVLELQKPFVSAQQDTIVFTNLQFYLTGICLGDLNDSCEPSNAFLVDIADSSTWHITFQQTNDYSKKQYLHFNLGVDSITSVSGAQGGNLDPSKGMYWAWQSGYINFKVEGTSPSCKTRKNRFQFHIGGYLTPYYAMRKISLPILSNSENFQLSIDLAKLLNTINLKEQNAIMIPGNAAMELADKAATIFRIE